MVVATVTTITRPFEEVVKDFAVACLLLLKSLDLGGGLVPAFDRGRRMLMSLRRTARTLLAVLIGT
jgi:hypothetical protein